jgi:hypothetical protein
VCVFVCVCVCVCVCACVCVGLKKLCMRSSGCLADEAKPQTDPHSSSKRSKYTVATDARTFVCAAITISSYPLFSTALIAYSTWKMRPSGEKVPHE